MQVLVHFVGCGSNFNFIFKAVDGAILVCSIVCYSEANLEPELVEGFQDSVNQVISINHGYLDSNDGSVPTFISCGQM